ncbi:MAG: carboxylesterase family protein [Bacteroidales bacterium]|nr:carboxylesterase family protein [Bacteroidales bacterium]
MKKIVLFLMVMAISMQAQAQETYRFAQRDTCSLYLDIYRAAEGSETTFQGIKKPAVMFVFGGGFIGGERSGEFSVQWFNRLNEEGYTVVTIDYRLGMKGYDVGKGLVGAYKASSRFLLSQEVGVEDVFSAVSFLNENKDLGIDVNNLVISGSSAGAIISVASEYAIANGTARGIPAGFNFKGVMSFAGAIISNSGAPKFKSAPCPILFLHGTADKAVAYNKFGALGHGIWGSSYLSKQFASKGWTHCIYRFTGLGHVVAAYMNYLWPIEKEFLEQNVILGVKRSVDAEVDDPSLPTWNGADVSMDQIYDQ